MSKSIQEIKLANQKLIEKKLDADERIGLEGFLSENHIEGLFNINVEEAARFPFAIILGDPDTAGFITYRVESVFQNVSSGFLMKQYNAMVLVDNARVHQDEDPSNAVFKILTDYFDKVKANFVALANVQPF